MSINVNVKKSLKTMSGLLVLSLMLTGCSMGKGKDNPDERTENARYLGVENYGAEDVNKDTKENFRYRFLVSGKEVAYKIDPGEANENGGYQYSIQNQLKEGYDYEISVIEETVVSAVDITPDEEVVFTPVVKATPGSRTLSNFLKTAMEPVGTTLYIYGGGWDWQDEGPAIQARTIGVSPDWVRFFNEQDVNYTYKEKDGDEAQADPMTSYYPYGGYNEYYYAGLDCSGYLGWVIYNTFETENGKEGYVGGSTGFAKRLSKIGFGEWTQDISIPAEDNDYIMKPGDIMSINGHVWISLGTCSDKSIVILHSTPASSRTGQPGGGVELSAIGLSSECEAYRLADQYMSEFYPVWYERYPVKLADPETYFTFEGENAGKFTWDTTNNTNGLSDPDNIQEMDPDEVLKFLFS